MIRSTEIQIVSVKEIKLNPKNRNKHSDDQIDRLSKIIEYQGFRNPLIISSRTGMLVAGHGRYSAAKKLKLKQVPVMVQDFENEDQEYACMVSDNAIASWSELDLSGINSDIGDLGPDFDIDLLGIKGFEIEVADKFEGDEDAVPEHVEPKTKLGDIYQLGRHRLMCGDSTAITDVDRLMAMQKADMVFTDPPYGMSFQSNFKKEKFRPIENDDRILDIAPVIWAASKESSVSYVCTRWDVYPKWFEQFAEFKIKNCVVWSKPAAGLGDLKSAYCPSHEFIIVAHKGVCELRGKRYGDVWQMKKDATMSYQHPTQKPVELSEFAIENHSDAGSCVLDLFGGSGSTLIACEKTNRTCFMMELDPHYVDVIVARWEKYTGKKAELLNG